MSPRLLSVVAVVMFTACASHEKDGDRAAVLGDWKAAYHSYRVALANDPDSAQLKDKFEHARREAVTDAARRAASCTQAQDWMCAESESRFAMELDPTNSELLATHANAARSLSLQRLSNARLASSRGQHHEALDLVIQVGQAAADPQVAAEHESTRRQVVASALQEVDRLQRARQIVPTRDLLAKVVVLDGSQRARFEAVEAEYNRYLDAEQARLLAQADQALAQHQWAQAEGLYREAHKLRPNPSIDKLARYARAVGQAEEALSRRDLPQATAGYKEAVQTGQDRDGYAAAQLDRIELRPYAVRIKTLVARPVRPNGSPWVGPPSLALFRIAASFVPGPHGAFAQHILDSVTAIPPENRPTLHIELSSIDGRKFVTPSREALYTNYGSYLVVHGNVLEERRLGFRVVNTKGRTEDLGYVEIPLRDLIARREVTLSDRSIATLQLAADRADGMAQGAMGELTEVGAPAVPVHEARPVQAAPAAR